MDSFRIQGSICNAEQTHEHGTDFIGELMSETTVAANTPSFSVVRAANLGACGRCYVKPSPSKSLRDISRDYFDSEANSDFLSDTAVFVALIAAVAVPIISAVSAMLELFRTLPL